MAASRADVVLRDPLLQRFERAQEQALEVLLAVSSRAARAENLAGLYRRLARTFGKLVGAGRVVFWRLGDNGVLIPIAGGYKGDSNFLAKLEPVSCGPDGEGFASQVVFGDLIFRASTSDVPEEFADVLEAFGVASMACVPWRAGDERLGMLAAYDSTRPDGFSREDAWVLQSAGLAAGLVTRLWRTQEELRQSVERLASVDAARQMLLRTMTAVVERERQRFVSQLHDDALQKLTAAELNLARARNGHVDDETLEAVQDELKQMEGALRRLVLDIRPPALEASGGLEQSIGDRLEMLEAAGIKPQLDLDVPADLSLDIREIVFRQVAEAIGNVERHSGAKNVQVSLKVVDGGILGRVRDDGRGFVVSDRTDLPGHLGLLGLRERALMAGGRYKIESKPGSGTYIEFWIPLTE